MELKIKKNGPLSCLFPFAVFRLAYCQINISDFFFGTSKINTEKETVSNGKDMAPDSQAPK